MKVLIALLSLATACAAFGESAIVCPPDAPANVKLGGNKGPCYFFRGDSGDRHFRPAKPPFRPKA